MMNFALSLMTAVSSFASNPAPIAKVPAACYTLSRKAALEAVLQAHPKTGAYVRNTDFARTADDGAVYITVWVKRADQEFADPVGVYVRGEGLNCVIDSVIN